MQEIEERLAHVMRMVDELSDVVARQDRELSEMRVRVERLVRREAEREQEATGGIVLGDERPPHY